MNNTQLNRILKLSLILVLFSTSIFAYEGRDNRYFRFEEEQFSIHPKIGMNYDFYNVNFSGFLGSVNCGLFEKGFGWGIPISINLEKYFNRDFFGEIQVGFNYGKGYLVQELSFPMRDLSTGNVVEITTENQMNMTLGFWEINPGAGFNIIDKDNYVSRLVGGFRLFLPLIKDFEQKEVITSPENAVFTNINDVRSRERPLAAGTISTFNTPILSVDAGIEALTEKYGSYKLSFGYNLNNFTTDGDWKALSLRLEFGYRIPVWQELEEPYFDPEKPVEAKPVPVVVVKKEPVVNLRNLKVEGTIEVGNELLASLPIVNDVFFETNSSDIPSNYAVTGNNSSAFSGNAVQIHKNLLPRIAEIIKKNSNASIILQSATSGETENNSLELSKKRAENVRNALISLGVPENKIKTENLITPKNPSNQDFAEGKLENQRVDIIVRNAPLQEYVDLQKYAIFKGKIIFDAMMVDTEGEIVEVHNNLNNKLLELTKTGTYEIPLDYRLPENFAVQDINLIYAFRQQEQVLSDKINYSSYKQNQVDLNLENFLAILRFDYNSSQLTDENQELIKQLTTKLPSGATIQILGSTDELGTQQRNSILAKERAENTKNLIQSVAKDKFKIEIGTNSDKFQEETPEGRFLNRSIRIKVKK